MSRSQEGRRRGGKASEARLQRAQTALLLDVNVLVALAWPNHAHHGAAIAWFTQVCKEGLATCAAAIALRHRGRLATFDRELVNLSSAAEHAVLLIPA